MWTAPIWLAGFGFALFWSSAALFVRNVDRSIRAEKLNIGEIVQVALHQLVARDDDVAVDGPFGLRRRRRRGGRLILRLPSSWPNGEGSRRRNSDHEAAGKET